MALPHEDPIVPTARTAPSFWKRVVKTDGCWEWTGARSKKGYGQVWVGRAVKAHRLSWVLHFGEIPKGMLVCHRCDNPPCVNPARLFLGTNDENMADAKAKGRFDINHARGEKSGKAVLDTADIREIRRLRAAGMPGPAVAKLYGICRSNVTSIANRWTWRHVP